MPRRPGPSKKDIKARKQKKRQAIIGIVLTFLMVVSLAAIFTSSTGTASNEYNYNEYTFKLEQLQELGGQQAFVTQVNNQEVYFYSLPQDSFRIPVEGNLSEILQSSPGIVISSNPASEYSQAYDLIAYDMSVFSGKQIMTATPEYAPLYPRIPIFTCENATATNTPTVFLNMTVNETAVNINGSCIQVNFMQQDIAYIRDRLIYSSLGIINR